MVDFREVSDIELDEPTFREVGDIELDEPTQGFVEGVSESLGKRAGDVKDYMQRDRGIGADLIGTGPVVAGQLVGAAEDVMGETARSLYKARVPEQTQEALKEKFTEFSKTRVGRAGISALQGGMEAWGEFEDEHPDVALIIGSTANLMGAGIGLKTGQLVAGEVLDVSKDTLKLLDRAMPPSVKKAIKNKTNNAFLKAINPTIKKNKSIKQTKEYLRKANNAVEDIVDDIDIIEVTDEFDNVLAGVLPTNLKQFSEAIESLKKNVFQEYDAIAKKAGDAGAKVDLTDTINELDIMINDKGNLPDLRKHALAVKKELEEMGSFTAVEAQTRLKALNSKLRKRIDYNSASPASVDQLVANKLRKSLNDVVEKTTGEAYGDLKRKYGYLSEIEESVNKKAVADMKKKTKGFVDYSDVYTTGELFRGGFTGDMGALLKGIGGKVAKAHIKNLNEPNKMIMKMFEDVDKAITAGREAKMPLKPKSWTFRQLQKLTPQQKQVAVEYIESGFSPERAIKKAVGSDYNTAGSGYNPKGSVTRPDIDSDVTVRKGEPEVKIKTKRQQRIEDDALGREKAIVKSERYLKDLDDSLGSEVVSGAENISKEIWKNPQIKVLTKRVKHTIEEIEMQKVRHKSVVALEKKLAQQKKALEATIKKQAYDKSKKGSSDPITGGYNPKGPVQQPNVNQMLKDINPKKKQFLTGFQ